MPSETLKRAVMRQLNGKAYLPDVSRHGAGGGFHGFTYTEETVSFFRRNRCEILAAVAEMAEGLGESQIEMVQGFKCLGKDYTEDEIGRILYGGDMTGDDADVIANALSWFALEEVAREYMDQVEDQKAAGKKGAIV